MRCLRWFGTIAQVLGVFELSTRLAQPAAAFATMLVGSATWLLIACRERDWPLAALNAAFTASNVIGIWRWLP